MGTSLCQAEYVRSHELTTGRTFGIAFDHDDDFFDTLTAFCTANNIRQGYIPMFIAGFAEAEIVGTCEKLANPATPRLVQGPPHQRRSPRLRHPGP